MPDSDGGRESHRIGRRLASCSADPVRNSDRELFNAPSRYQDRTELHAASERLCEAVCWQAYGKGAVLPFPPVLRATYRRILSQKELTNTDSVRSSAALRAHTPSPIYVRRAALAFDELPGPRSRYGRRAPRRQGRARGSRDRRSRQGSAAIRRWRRAFRQTFCQSRIITSSYPASVHIRLRSLWTPYL